MQMQAVPTVYVSPQPPQRQERHYNKKQSLGLGITQIAVGVISFILTIVGISISAHAAGVSSGIWCGIFYIVAGALGVAAGRNPTTGLIVGCMVMSIIAAFMTIGQLTYGSIAYSLEEDYWTIYWVSTAPDESAVRGRKAVDMLHVIMALIEFGAAIWQSVLTCIGCCCQPARQQMMQTVTVQQGGAGYGGQGQGQVVFVNGGGAPTSNVTYVTPSGQVVMPQGMAVHTTTSAYPQAAYPQAVPAQAYPAQQYPAQGAPPVQQCPAQGAPPVQQYPPATGPVNPPPYNPAAPAPPYTPAADPNAQAPPPQGSYTPAFNADYK